MAYLRSRPLRDKVALCLAALAIVLPLARVLTYQQWADGHWEDYIRALAFPLLVAIATWPLVRLQLSRGTAAAAILPWLAVVGVMVPGDAVHYTRLANPIMRTGQQMAGDDFAGPPGPPSPQRWLQDATAGAAISIRDGELVIVTPPGVIGSVDLVMPRQPSELRFETIWLPRGVSNEAFDEQVTWNAAIVRSQPFAVVAETRRLIIEATSYGLHIVYRDATEKIFEQTVELPSVSSGAMNQYEIVRKDGVARLRVNDEAVWTFADTGRLQFVRFGEVKADPLHGGTLRVSNVHYVRTFDRSVPVSRVPRRT